MIQIKKQKLLKAITVLLITTNLFLINVEASDTAYIDVSNNLLTKI